MKTGKRDLRSIFAAIVFIAIGGLALYDSKDFSPLGSVFPRTIAVMMILLSVVYIAFALLQRAEPAPVAPGSVPRRTLLSLTMFAWALLLHPAGFLLASIVCYAIILLIANYDRWTPRMAVVYAAAGSAVVGGLYGLFAYVLQVPFPKGIWL